MVNFTLVNFMFFELKYHRPFSKNSTIFEVSLNSVPFCQIGLICLI